MKCNLLFLDDCCILLQFYVVSIRPPKKWQLYPQCVILPDPFAQALNVWILWFPSSPMILKKCMGDVHFPHFSPVFLTCFNCSRAGKQSQKVKFSAGARLLPTLMIIEHGDSSLVTAAIYSCFLAKHLGYLRYGVGKQWEMP